VAFTLSGAEAHCSQVTPTRGAVLVTQQDTGTSLRLHLEPTATAAEQVRRVLRRLAAGTVFAGRLDDAELGATELVTNAVLHGRAPMTVQIDLDADCLRVAVVDGSAVSPSFSLLDPTAVTGRGLLLVAAVADRWGVEPEAQGKTVWMELSSTTPSPEETADLESLLESWGDELTTDPAQEQVRVLLTDLDVSLLAQSEAHVEGVLRELALLSHAESTDARLGEAAGQVLGAAAAFEGVRNELKRQLTAAVTRGSAQVDVELRVTRSDAELVRDYAHAIDRADRLCGGGALLIEEPSRQVSATRRGYLRQILAQLGS
jgi:anti-sigma regulatory factor (Ser/Thr protein kinase)